MSTGKVAPFPEFAATFLGVCSHLSTAKSESISVTSAIDDGQTGREGGPWTERTEISLKSHAYRAHVRYARKIYIYTVNSVTIQVLNRVVTQRFLAGGGSNSSLQESLLSRQKRHRPTKIIRNPYGGLRISLYLCCRKQRIPRKKDDTDRNGPVPTE